LTWNAFQALSFLSMGDVLLERARTVKIGQLARACGVSPDTLRHYERLQLLRPARRTPAGYRLYDADAAGRIRLVQAALAVGFTLRELSRLFRERDAGRPPCRTVRDLAAAKLESLEQNLADMVRLRDALRRLLTIWDARLKRTPPGRWAGLLDALGSGEIELDLPPRPPAASPARRRKS
jgi:DNA-binding transcriptional MerR regulator